MMKPVKHVYGKRAPSSAEKAFSQSARPDVFTREASSPSAPKTAFSHSAIASIVDDDDVDTQVSEKSSQLHPTAESDDEHNPPPRTTPPPRPKFAKAATSPHTGGTRSQPQGQNSSLRKMKSESEHIRPVKSVRFTYGSPKKETEEQAVPQSAREAFESREAGKSLQIADDIQFLVDGLQANQGTNIRALSVFKLAKECESPDSRMYLRAHSLLPTILTSLKDSFLHPNLGLNTACLLYMLAKDSITPDIEPLCVPLLGDLARPSSACNAPTAASNKQQERMAAQIRTLIESRRSLDSLPKLSSRHLALETCCTVLAQQSRASFRSELRVSGMLDDIINALQRLTEELQEGQVETPAFVDADLSLRVLQSAIFLDPANQQYLVHLRDSAPLSVLATLTTLLVERLAVAERTKFKDEVSLAVSDCLFAALRVLLGLTHNNEFACAFLAGFKDFAAGLVHLCHRERFPADMSHDGLVLLLSLLVNLVEHNAENRVLLVDCAGASVWKILLALYEQGASDSADAPAPEDTSRSIVAAYTAVLLCFLCKDQARNRKQLASVQPAHYFKDMAEHLQQFEAYQQTAGLSGGSGMAAAIELLLSYETAKD